MKPYDSGLTTDVIARAQRDEFRADLCRLFQFDFGKASLGTDGRDNWA